MLHHRHCCRPIWKTKNFFGLIRDSGHGLYRDSGHGLYRDRDRDHGHCLRDPYFYFYSYSYF
jgi:hypothetical protein